ncbi:MAG TPA: phosphate ABC transporter permease subunit PstC [Rugosimonospora sp.]|nr:phosphate ABC transporter permease subunit PstC [Rugosimonospora sp.]
MSEVDVPRRPPASLPLTDRVFHNSARVVGGLVLAITGSIGLFLAIQSVPTMRHYGLHFFVENQWQPQKDLIGISAVLVGTACIAGVALVIAFPLALLTALYISDFAPVRVRGFLVSLVDLMAAVPSIVYGLWGRDLMQPYLADVAHWLHQHFGFIPFFKVDADPNAPIWQQAQYTSSAFIAGVAVSMMVLPMACAVMREVFAQAPVGEREAALALGATRWGMIRTVVLPFGRGGIIGGTMLALGRALGETIAVALIISPAFDIKVRVLEVGSISVSSLIANRFAEATTLQLSALLMAGFVLFLITLLVNTLAAIVVNRSRSGAATDI